MTKSEFDELAEFYKAANLPYSPIRLDGNTVIESPADFVAGHLEFIEAKLLSDPEPTKSRLVKPYVNRLIKLRQIIEGNGT